MDCVGDVTGTTVLVNAITEELSLVYKLISDFVASTYPAANHALSTALSLELATIL